MTVTDPIEALRARVATLSPAQREVLRAQLEQRGIPWSKVAPAEQTTARPERLPLSPSQLHFWVLQQLHPQSSAYHIAFSWHIEGKLDVDALQFSLRHIIERHEPLRTCFPAEGGIPWQQVRARYDFVLEQSDLSSSPQQLAERMRGVANKPFDLAESPMIRAHLFQLGPDRYSLAVCLHHIVADGWSRGILIRELAACYRTRTSGTELVLPLLQQHFTDIVLQRQDWLTTPAAAKQKAYWQKQLAGLAEQELPSDRPRDALGQSLGCATLMQTLPERLTQQVRTVSSELGVTPFMLLLAVFKLLLHRYTGEQDIAVGAPVAGRREPEASDLVGLFVNTLVLRTALDPAMRFGQWLNVVRSTFADAFENQDVPFAQIVEILGVERSAGRNPLFQTMFQVQTEGYRHQNAQNIDLGTSELAVRQEMLPLDETKFDLSWHIMERDNGLSLAIEYRTGLFDAKRIQRMIGHFECLLTNVLADTDGKLSELDYVSADEHLALISAGRGEARDVPATAVHEVISSTAKRYPDKLALICGERSLTYRELDEAATSLALYLASQAGISGSGARIAICLPREQELVIAILAVLKTGAAYIPLDPDHPAERLSMILEDADVALVLTQDKLLACDRPVLDPTAINTSVPASGLPDFDASQPAYLIYTSGSTGRPKGVPIHHSSLLNLLNSMATRVGIAEGDRLLAVTTVSFDIAVLELLLPLITGATVILADRNTVLSTDALAGAIEHHDITHMQATPALWRALLDGGWQGRRQLKALCGGEAVDSSLTARLLKRVGGLWNVYGPTETTIWSGALRVEERHLDHVGVPIGAPLDNTQFHVLDSYRKPVPYGIAGELFIGGAGLSQGYWNKPDLTASSFPANPLAEELQWSERLYKTGDRVLRHANGEMEFLGRADHQIKLRGYRIETGEIESLLQEYPDITQALVTLDKERERLIAYYTISHAVVADGIDDALRDFLAKRLPRYMIPAAFTLLDAFPLNTNGKVDRKRLPLPETRIVSTVRVDPRNEQEEILLSIWQQVLRRDDFGVEENFFDLGGDSIVGMQIVARAKARHLVLQPVQIFEYQTVAAQALAAKVRQVDSKALSLSIWQSHIASIASPPWLVTAPVTAEVEQSLAAAISHMSSAYPTLDFRLEGGRYVKRSKLPVIQTIASDKQLLDWASQNIVEESLWQLGLYRSGDERRMVIAAHPVLFDGVAVSRFANELVEVAAKLQSGQMPTIPDVSNYSDWLDHTETLTRPAATAFDGDGAGADFPPEAAKPVNIILDATVTQHLLMLAERQRTSVEAIALAVLSDTLLQWSGKEALDADVLTRGYPDRRHSPDIGNTTRLLPVRLTQSRGAIANSAAALINQISAIEGQGIDPSKNHASVLFSWRETCGRGLEWLSVPQTPLPSGYALSIAACLRDDGLTFQWIYDPGQLREATVQRLAQRHLAGLVALNNKPSQAAPKLDRFLNQLKRAGER